MADFFISVRAKELGVSLSGLSASTIAQVKAAVRSLASATRANIEASATASLKGQKLNTYRTALSQVEQDGDTYTITLRGKWASELEEGGPPGGVDLRKVLLASNKIVGVGSRAGSSWVRTSESGKKYAMVPFEHRPYAKAAGSSDMGSAIRSLSAVNQVTKEVQPITKTFYDLSGAPLTGKVARTSAPGNDRLSGVTKYQYAHKSGQVRSRYMTFRVIREDSPGWHRPAEKALNAFKTAEKFVSASVDRIISKLLG